MAENKVNLLTEKFSVESAGKGTEGVKISGFALPFDTTSRNGFAYRKESIVKAHKSLEGKPMFFNHDIESLPIGKVESVSVDEKGMHYEATLIPSTDVERAIVEKVQKGLLDKVSIQCIYSNASVNEKTGEFMVDVAEFLELSVVGVPGFADTSLQAHEKLSKENKIKMAHKKLKEELEKPEDETSTEQDGEDQTEAPVTRAEFDELMSRISVLESRLDAADEEEQSEEEMDEEKPQGDSEEADGEMPADEEEPKKEEKIQRQTSAPSATQAKEYNKADVRFKRLML